MDTSKPLVSVFIVTYNSSDYIIEALESVRNQTYQNIELVVSDDCSSDDTLAKVKEWIDQNKGRFIRTEVVETPVNTGIPANYNRAVRACKGEWLKMMDGDDLILPNCIEDNVKYVLKNPNAHIVFSNMYLFKGKNRDKVEGKNFNSRRRLFFEKDAKSQMICLLKGNILPSQTCFILASILKDNCYDERYRLLEDYPMWLKLSQMGERFFYFDDCTAMYRISDSVSSSKKNLYSVSYMDVCKQHYIDIVLPLIKQNNASEAYNQNQRKYMMYNVCLSVLKNRRNFLTIPFYWLFRVFIFKFCYFRL